MPKQCKGMSPHSRLRCHKLGRGTKRRGEYLPFRCHGNGIQQRRNPIPENRVKTQLGYEAAAILWSHSRSRVGGRSDDGVYQHLNYRWWKVSVLTIHYIDSIVRVLVSITAKEWYPYLAVALSCPKLRIEWQRWVACFSCCFVVQVQICKWYNHRIWRKQILLYHIIIIIILLLLFLIPPYLPSIASFSRTTISYGSTQ